MSLNKLDLSVYLGGANCFYISYAIIFGDSEHYLYICKNKNKCFGNMDEWIEMY